MYPQESQKNYVVLTDNENHITDLARNLFLLGNQLEFSNVKKSDFLRVCNLYNSCFKPETGFYTDKFGLEIHQCRDLAQLITKQAINLKPDTRSKLEASIAKHFLLLDITKGDLDDISKNRSLVVGHLNLCTTKEFFEKERYNF